MHREDDPLLRPRFRTQARIKHRREVRSVCVRGDIQPQCCRDVERGEVLRRAQDTAKALGRPFKTLAALGPGAMPEALLACAHWPHAKTPVMLVGHQPTLGMVVGDVLNQGPTEHAVRKGSVWWLRYRDSDGEGLEGQAVIYTVQTPQTV